MKLHTKKLRATIARLDRIVEDYKEETSPKKRDWRTYEQQFAKRLETAYDELRELVFQATEPIAVNNENKRGAKPKLSLEQKVLLLLLQRIVIKSNRSLSYMLTLFSWLADVKVSYKTIERLYSEELVLLALHNLHILILDKAEVKSVALTGDGTGFSLQIREHYQSHAQKFKDEAKTQELTSKKKSSQKKKRFIYSFVLMDLKTRLHIGFGTSFKSERDAYNQALEVAKATGIKVESIRLDRYYSTQTDVRTLQAMFGNITCFFVPKKNATVRGPLKWSEMVKQFVTNTKEFLKEYYRRNQSESNFAEDKRRTGWKFMQKRGDRLNTAIMAVSLWHNLHWLG